MSFQEKRTLTSIFSGLLVLAAYCIHAFGRVRAGIVDPGDLRFWAVTMLIFIGIGIGATIIIQIIFHILYSISVAVKKSIQENNCDEKEIEKTIALETVEDERDKLINLKATRVGFTIAGIGFVGGLLALLLNYPPQVMLNIFFLSFSFGSLCEGAAQLIYYRRGV